MICKKCNAEIPDNALFCGFCGAKVEVESPAPEAAPAVEESAPACASSKRKEGIASLFFGPYYIVAASFLSFWAFMAFINLCVSIGNGIFSFLLSAAFTVTPLVFGIMAIVAAWKIVADRKTVALENVKPQHKFFSIMRNFALAELIVVCVLGGLLFILVLILGVLLGSMGSGIFDILSELGLGTNLGLGMGGVGIGGMAAIVLVVAVLIIFGFLITYSVFMVKLYAAVRDYYGRLVEYFETGKYDSAKKPPVIFMYVMAGVAFIASLFDGGVGFLAGLALAGLLVSNALFFMNIDKKMVETESECDAVAEAPAASESVEA